MRTQILVFRPLNRRAILALLAALVGSSPQSLPAQTYPSAPIRIVVPFPAAGGPLDTAARIVADELRSTFGQAGVVENRTGAGGRIGTESVFRAQPDGYTILCAPQFVFAVGHLLFGQPTFDARQFEPISMIAQYPAVLVARPSLPVTNPAELIAHARANPGKVSYGSQGIGTLGHLAFEQIKTAAQINVLHVPLRGSLQAVTELLGGHIDVLVDTLLNTRSNIEAGTLKLIGVGKTQRLKDFPDAPAISEVLPGFEAMTAVGFAAPPGTPERITQTIANVIRTSVTRPELNKRLNALGLEPLGTTPNEMRAYLAKTESRWAPIIESAHIRIN
jgi:tripartite-type tricarboxylate transporter receptor subunit TctC